jgi:putative methyltransferase (TIGR04325 family)
MRLVGRFVKRLLSGIKHFLLPPPVSWSGDFPSWHAAEQKCEGYSSQAVIESVVRATQKVVAGEACYERDSVLFRHHDYLWDVIAVLYRTAYELHRPVTVFDFGGALGSVYRQNQKMVHSIIKRWVIIEQPKFVEIGERDFSDTVLDFRNSMDEASVEDSPDIILFSSVLQYLPDPWTILLHAKLLDPKYIAIRRTPIVQEPRMTERITVQTVHKPIYEARYPCRFLLPHSIVENMLPEYSPIASIDSRATAGQIGMLGDFVFGKNSNSSISGGKQ